MLVQPFWRPARNKHKITNKQTNKQKSLVVSNKILLSYICMFAGSELSVASDNNWQYQFSSWWLLIMNSIHLKIKYRMSLRKINILYRHFSFKLIPVQIYKQMQSNRAKHGLLLRISTVALLTFSKSCNWISRLASCKIGQPKDFCSTY